MLDSNTMWKLDIEEFDRWKQRLELVKTSAVRSLIIQRMNSIRVRWPHIIKQNEIPES